MAALSYCAVANHVFITIFTAYRCKVYRVVARKVHPSLLRVGKNFRVQLSARKCHTMKHPWRTARSRSLTLSIFIET